MKKGFSLLELIFAIVVIGIIASFAIPKYLDTRDSAVVSTIKRDVSATITSIQSYHLVNGAINKISDAVSLNAQNWKIEDTKVVDSNDCLSIEVKTSEEGVRTLSLTVDAEKTGICTKIREGGLSTKEYKLF